MTTYESVFSTLLAVFLLVPAIASLFGRRQTYEQQDRNRRAGGPS